MKGKAYAQAGVDIDLGNRIKSRLPQWLKRAQRSEVLGAVGGFGGLFAFNARAYRQPVLVSSADGVGTKLKIAFALARHDTVGQDLVNHCVNDIAALGAEPLFFLDYIGAGKLEPTVFKQIIAGFARACQANHCALIGGETAQMPGFYRPGEYDLCGTIVGVVERKRIVDGREIEPGDAVLGLASSGLHTNGYSLARKIFFEEWKWTPRTRVPELGGEIGDELLKTHLSYGPLIARLLKRFNRAGQPPAVKGLAHITGGGFVDNLPRVLPKRCDARIWKGSWEMPPIFQLLEQRSNVPEPELYQAFNMGIGLAAVVAAERAHDILRRIWDAGQEAWIIGEIVKGRGRARLE